MFGETDEASLQFGGIGREGCGITSIVHLIEEFKNHDDTAVRGLSSETLEGCTPVKRFNSGDIHDIGHIFQT
jgi:hypothetical protein